MEIRRSLILVGMLLLVGLTLTGGWAAQDDGKTSAYWDINGCWVTLEVHHPADLGTFTKPNEVRESLDNPVSVTSNCLEWALTTKATEVNAPIAADEVLKDFDWRVGKCPTGATCQDTYINFPGLNKEMKVATTEKLHKAEFGMDYRYTSDMNDLPGKYEIMLVYTVTAD